MNPGQKRVSAKTFAVSGFARPILVFLLFLATVVSLQWVAGVYSAEFNGYADEPSHYVTGLMVRDYVTALAPTHPLRYAEQYYLHYPYLALGHWPPFFYVIQAGWTLLFSDSSVSVLFLMAVLTALLSTSLCAVLSREFSALAGIAGGLLLIAMPLTQSFTGRLMAEIPVALLTFWALLSFARYVDTLRWQDAVRFGILSALAILTKPTALALVLVPPLALLLRGRLRVLMRPSCWLAPLAVIALCGPWHALLQLIFKDNLLQSGHLHVNAIPLSIQFGQIFETFGWGLFLLVTVGVALRIAVPALQRRAVSGLWAEAAALLVGITAFRIFVGAAHEPRHLLIVMAPLIMFLSAGIAWLGARLPMGRLSPRLKTVLVAAAVGLVFFVQDFSIPRKAPNGLREAAVEVLAHPEFQKSAFFVSSQGDGEGEFIAEVAMRESRPGHYVLRATKLLAQTTWSLDPYRSLFHTPAEVLRCLEAVPVGILVLDEGPGLFSLEHHRLLRDMVKEYPDRWQPIGTYPRKPSPGAPGAKVLVYRSALHAESPPDQVLLDMRRRLGKILQN